MKTFAFKFIVSIIIMVAIISFIIWDVTWITKSNFLPIFTKVVILLLSMTFAGMKENTDNND